MPASEGWHEAGMTHFNGVNPIQQFRALFTLLHDSLSKMIEFFFELIVLKCL